MNLKNQLIKRDPTPNHIRTIITNLKRNTLWLLDQEEYKRSSDNFFPDQEELCRSIRLAIDFISKANKEMVFRRPHLKTLDRTYDISKGLLAISSIKRSILDNSLRDASVSSLNPAPYHASGRAIDVVMLSPLWELMMTNEVPPAYPLRIDIMMLAIYLSSHIKGISITIEEDHLHIYDDDRQLVACYIPDTLAKNNHNIQRDASLGSDMFIHLDYIIDPVPNNLKRFFIKQMKLNFD